MYSSNSSSLFLFFTYWQTVLRLPNKDKKNLYGRLFEKKWIPVYVFRYTPIQLICIYDVNFTSQIRSRKSEFTSIIFMRREGGSIYNWIIFFFFKYPSIKMGASPRVNFWGTNFQSLFKFDTIVIDNIIFKLHHQVYCIFVLFWQISSSFNPRKLQ